MKNYAKQRTTETLMTTESKFTDVLFLDIDGVLNSKAWYETNVKEILREGGTSFWRSVAELDPGACALVNQFCEENNLKIVISSTWRKRHDPREIEAMFHKKGLFAEVIGSTPSINNAPRGREIAEFIKTHPALRIRKYIILDDDSDMLKDQPFVRTTWAIGVQPENIAEANEVLRGQLVSAA